MDPVPSRACALILVAASASATAPSARAASPLYGDAQLRARLRNAEVRESSGLAASRANPGLYWTHNDSGNAAVLYAFDHEGSDVARYAVEDARNVDWEDMAAFTLGEKHYLAIADTGDRPGVTGARPARPWYTIYVVDEPRVARSRPADDARVKLAGTIAFRYENGPHDCEAIAVDVPQTCVYLVTKTLSLRSEVYRLALAFDAPTRRILVARVVARAQVALVTGMDISADGRRAAVLTYLGIAYYAVREGDTWPDAMSRAPAWIPIPRVPMAEGVAFDRDGRTLLFTCELTPGAKEGAPLYALSKAAHAPAPPRPATP
jgi:hypothetical protein